MSASDLPETYSSSVSMARALSSYIADPYVVRRYVLDRFPQAPDIQTIRRLRKQHFKAPPASEPFKAHEGYYPSELADALVVANERFLAALTRERKLSQAVTAVDRALEFEIASAREAATC